jgi:hypothetical protein
MLAYRALTGPAACADLWSMTAAAMSAGYLGDPVQAGETLIRGIEGLLRIHIGRGLEDGAAPAPTETPSVTTAVADIECSPPSA